MMRHAFLRASRHAFTLAEMLVAMTGSILVLGALLLSSTQLQRALYSSERYSAKQSDQRRLIDYMTRDLRRAIGVGASTAVNGSGAVPLAAATTTIERGTSLVVTLPGYYQSESAASETYDEALPPVVAGNYVDYGSEAGHAAGVRIIFRKEYIEAEGGDCFVRLEGDSQTVIARDAADLRLQVAVSGDGRAASILVTYTPKGRVVDSKVTSHSQILLRNIRTDLP